MVKRSSRIPDDLSPNRLAAARARIGEAPYDLTVSNPTICGFSYPADLLDELADPAALTYNPDPRGPRPARSAIAAEYRRWDLEVDPDRVTLTASTSEAYAFLFRLLCDPGDSILVPAPSYPLFDQLARLDGVQILSYALEADTHWRFDFSTLEDASAQVRAVVVVHPNNPTGSFVHPEDARRLVALCGDRGWALIADEVFLPYTLDGGPGSNRSFAGVEECLCFTLGGLSKSAGLPQLKLAWIVTGGPEEEVRKALEGLDYVADAYLSVATPIARASGRIFTAGTSVRDQINERCRTNLESLRQLAKNHPSVSVPPVGGGWSALIRVPSVERDQDLCVRLLVERGVAVHPGFFYDFPHDGYLVVSLLTPEGMFRRGIERVLETVTAVLDEDPVPHDTHPRTTDPSATTPQRPGTRPMARQRAPDRSAAVLGLTLMAAGTAVLFHPPLWFFHLGWLDSLLRPVVAQPSVVIAGLIFSVVGAVILSRLAAGEMPRLMLADRLPRIVLRASPRGVSLLAAALLSLFWLCFLVWSEGQLHLYLPLLTATAALAFAGLKICDASPISAPSQTSQRYADLAMIAVLVVIVGWAATRAITDWRFAWVGDEGFFFLAARNLAQGITPSIFNLAYVYGTHPVADTLWQSLFLRMFGENIIGWRLAEVAVLAMAAALTYWAFVRMVTAPVTERTTLVRLPALIGGLVVGGSAYSLAFALIGYNNLHTMVPTLLVLVCLVQVRRRPTASALLALGLTSGLCAYTFLATVLIWGVLAVYLLPGLVGPARRERRTALALAAAGFSIMVVPLVIANQAPLLTNLGAQNTLGLDPQTTGERSLFLGLVRSVVAFWHNVQWFHHYVAGPLLGPLAGALAILGIATGWRVRRQSAGDRYLVTWLFVGIAVVALTFYTDQPSITRLLVVMPAAALLAARGAMALATVLSSRLRLSATATALSLCVCAVIIPAAGLYQLLVAGPRLLPPHPNGLTLRLLREHPGSPVFEVAPKKENNRQLMLDFYPWYADRHHWIMVEDLEDSIPALDPASILLVYENDVADEVSRRLPATWERRPFPGVGVHPSIWIFSRGRDVPGGEIPPPPKAPTISEAAGSGVSPTP